MPGVRDAELFPMALIPSLNHLWGDLGHLGLNLYGDPGLIALRLLDLRRQGLGRQMLRRHAAGCLLWLRKLPLHHVRLLPGRWAGSGASGVVLQTEDPHQTVIDQTIQNLPAKLMLGFGAQGDPCCIPFPQFHS